MIPFLRFALLCFYGSIIERVGAISLSSIIGRYLSWLFSVMRLVVCVFVDDCILDTEFLQQILGYLLAIYPS